MLGNGSAIVLARPNFVGDSLIGDARATQERVEIELNFRLSCSAEARHACVME